ncbi:MAG: glutamine synthetase [Catenulispora sp. 13_1_20CM_3_70_7]|nr:MAG: glutamine synthetase [Catenulispora sp. 13_1_20CM_3_70_7]
MPARTGMLTLQQLRDLISVGRIDTVQLAMTDMQGRLQGKRLSAEFFLDEVAAHDTEACSYLLAVDVDMNTVHGYETSSWDTGYGDFVLKPDLSTLRNLPWEPGTALVLADVVDHHGEPVAPSPRQVLKKQLARLAERGWTAYAGTELEFMVFNDSYQQAWGKGYREMEPAVHYNGDYSMLGGAFVEPLLKRIRTGMTGAGMYVESAKGECNLGQQEIAFRYADALTTCDNHVIYKNGAKTIAFLRSADGTPVMSDPSRPYGFSEMMEHFLAGQLAFLRDFTLLYAPNINSYKRYAHGSFAPTGIAWGRDNRTCSMRVVVQGLSLRVENRVPGGDVNPYLAIAGMIAAGLAGIDHGLTLPPEFTGNAYEADVPRVPDMLTEAVDMFSWSEPARLALGNDVVEHYINMGRVELAAFQSTVTDWERFRSFERM